MDLYWPKTSLYIKREYWNNISTFELNYLPHPGATRKTIKIL